MIRLKETLSDPDKRAALAKRLLTYPGVTAESVEQQLSGYELRVSEKDSMLERGYSNALAERLLDRRGYRRPPGWHSVFFYPDSYRPWCN